jgi:8-oxo-dGTP pyrophosphatase MutT (NUDIX family)
MPDKNDYKSIQHSPSFWDWVGRLAFYVTWPGIWLVIKLTPPRTRVIIVHNQRVLVLRDWLGTGAWSLPGGGLHRGEDPHTGAIREVQEEAGVVLVAEQLHELGKYKIRSSGTTTKYEVFWVELADEPVLQLKAGEIAAAQWIPLDEVSDAFLSSSTLALLQTFRVRSNLVE